MISCSVKCIASRDEVPQFLEEQDDVDALRHDQPEIERKLQPARREDEQRQRTQACVRRNGRFGSHAHRWSLVVWRDRCRRQYPCVGRLYLIRWRAFEGVGRLCAGMTQRFAVPVMRRARWHRRRGAVSWRTSEDRGGRMKGVVFTRGPQARAARLPRPDARPARRGARDQGVGHVRQRPARLPRELQARRHDVGACARRRAGDRRARALRRRGRGRQRA